MWYQLYIEQCQAHEIESLSERLEASGALSITLTDQHDEPLFEPEPGTTPLWTTVNISALYTAEECALSAKISLCEEFPHLYFHTEFLPEQDWERVCLQDFKPQRFGEKLWVCPSWCEPPEPDAVNLRLDPGLAFGTGTHASTSLCLQWLAQADLNNKIMIDYGCGSGILALAALKLGAKTVYATDIDEQALQATKKNAHANQIDGQSLQISLPQDLDTEVDVIIANILLAPLIKLATHFHKLLRNEGLLVVSGILNEQSPDLLAQYETHFTHLSAQQCAGWSLLVFKKGKT